MKKKSNAGRKKQFEDVTIVNIKIDKSLKKSITEHVNNGDLVLCFSAGGGGSLDEWLRRQDFRY